MGHRPPPPPVPGRINSAGWRGFDAGSLRLAGAESDARPSGRMARIYRETMGYPPVPVNVRYTFTFRPTGGDGRCLTG